MIDAVAWYESLRHKIWWRDIGFNECYHLMKITERAVAAGSKYYVQEMFGDELELTKIYEQCKILALLKEPANNQLP
jgi:hypothetical protein